MRPVNVYHPDILEQLRGCDGFMWRWIHLGGMFQIAQRLLPVLERELQLAVYPDRDTCWHYDDKVAQAFLLPAVGIPMPKTWVWFDWPAAREWLHTAPYPLVLKLAGGASSANVRLVRSAEEAGMWLDRLFGLGVGNLEPPPRPWSLRRRLRAAAKSLLVGQPLTEAQQHPWPLHRNYVLFQEFLPGNDWDTRVMAIGNRVFGFRRFNRPNDFRASGSHLMDYDPAAISLDFVRLAFLTAQRLRLQCCAMDGLWKEGQAVLTEISYTTAPFVIHDCPGHWELDGDPSTGVLRWVPGHVWPEEAQIEDFLTRLRDRQERSPGCEQPSLHRNT